MNKRYSYKRMVKQSKELKALKRKLRTQSYLVKQSYSGFAKSLNIPLETLQTLFPTKFNLTD